MELVAQLLNSVAAARPSELAMQEKLRTAQEEIQRLQTRLAQSNASLQATAKRFNDSQNSHMKVSTAYKRALMVRDMQAMVGDYLTEETTADYEVNKTKTRQLTEDVASLHDRAMAEGVGIDGISNEDAVLLYCTDADKQWLIDQLQHDITQHQFDIWAQ